MLSNALLPDTTHTLSTVATIGNAAPLGASVTPDGVNFSVFSRKATAVDLLLFDREVDAEPTDVIRIDPVTNPTYHYWHVFVPVIRARQLSGYRVHAPFVPSNRTRFVPRTL